MSDSINKLDKKYMELSLEINNEKITRTLEDSKLKVENIKESSLRISNDKKLNNLINEKYENIMKEIKDLKSKLDSKNLKNLEKSIEEDKNDGDIKEENENDGSKLLELKENELLKLKSELKYFMNLLNLAMIEENK